MKIERVCDEMPHEGLYLLRNRAAIIRVVIHHSVTELGADGDELRHCKNIARRHIRISGWPGIGYHFCVFPSGSVYQVNDIRRISYHVKGFNTTSVGVCLIGKLHKREPTVEQLEAAAWLVGLFGLPVVPHKALNKTACPGNWKAWGHIIKGE